MELVGQRVHPEDRVDFHDVIDRASRGATHFEHAYRLLLPDGRVKHVHALAHALEDASGNCEFVGAVMDVTERKRAEEAVLRSEKELRNVIDTIPAMVWSALPDGSNTYVNSRFVEYSGMSGEQMAGSGWQTATHPDDLQRHVDKWRASVGTGEPHENEMRFRRADGQYRWHLDRGLPLRDETGNILKWYGVVTDIEDRKRAEAFLAGEKRILEILAQAATLEEAAPKILQGICECLDWDVGALWRVDRDAGVLCCLEVWHRESLDVSEFEASTRARTIPPEVELPGRVWSIREFAYIPDVVHEAS